MDAAKLAEIEEYAKNVLRAKLPGPGIPSARLVLALVAEVRRLEGERGRMRVAFGAAIESAQEEGIHIYRGTDEPRRFVMILHAALDGPGGEGREA
jgi:hypothetical protein